MEEKFSCLNILPELHNCEEGRWKIFCIFRPDVMTMTIQKPDSRYEYKVIMSSLLWVSICKHSEPFTFVSSCGDNDWRQCGIVSKNVKHLITGFVSGLRRNTKPLQQGWSDHLWTGNILLNKYIGLLDAEQWAEEDRTENVGISIIACLYPGEVRI